MSSKTSGLLIVFLLILLPFGYAFYLWPNLPETIPTHFGISGKPDAWGKKESIFILPAIMGVMGLLVYLVFANIRKIDPKRYAQTDDSSFRQFALLIVTFIVLLTLIILYNIVNPELSMDKTIFGFLGVFFAALGLYMPRLNQNYFAGFRLPWTLENEQNWIATHQLAGKIWVIGGVAQTAAALIFEGKTLFFIFFAITLVMVIVPVVFSYRMFRQTVSEGQV